MAPSAAVHWNILLAWKRNTLQPGEQCKYAAVARAGEKKKKPVAQSLQRPQHTDPAWLALWKLPSVFVTVIWGASAVGMLARSSHSRIMEQFGTPITFINDNYLSIMLQIQIIHLHGVSIREALSRFAPR